MTQAVFINGISGFSFRCRFLQYVIIWFITKLYRIIFYGDRILKYIVKYLTANWSLFIMISDHQR